MESMRPRPRLGTVPAGAAAGGSIVPWAVAGPDPTRITKFQFGMPLTPQFRFEQDDESCTIFVSLTSAAAATRNTRVFCTDACLQVTCPPYFLQVDLFDDVDSQMCNTKITPGLATIKLFKRVSKFWDQLTSTGNLPEVCIAKKITQSSMQSVELTTLCERLYSLS